MQQLLFKLVKFHYFVLKKTQNEPFLIQIFIRFVQII